MTINPQEQHRAVAMLTAAHLCQHGIRIFPLAFGTKKPYSGESWPSISTSNFAQFNKIVPSIGTFNLAIHFGPESNLCDVEPDSEEGVSIIEGLMKEGNVRTIAYRSRRGIHRLFRYPKALEVLKNNNPKAHGLECRLGSGGMNFYSACPPSLHPDTNEYYEWLPGCAPWDVSAAEMPEHIVKWFLANVKQGGKELSVTAHDDGYLPPSGCRHEWLLHFSKTLYQDWHLPLEDCMELTRYMSQKTGSYYEEGRGENELKNLFKGLRRKHDPAKELSVAVNMDDVHSLSEDLQIKRLEDGTGVSAEIPSHIFPPMIEAASQHAKKAGFPRNLWLMTCLGATFHCLGQAVRVRASQNHETIGLQTYAFGVGGSGSGKSRTMNALLRPIHHSPAITTEASPEGLVTHMTKNPRAVTLELTEGKDFFKMLSRYSQNGQGSDNSLFHKCWSGDRVWRTLQKGTFGLDSPFLNVIAAIQKINLNQMPPNDCNDGLLQRMLVYPIGNIPRKEDAQSLVHHNLFLIEWANILTRLSEVKPAVGSPTLSSLVSGAGLSSAPLVLTNNEEAYKIWLEYATMKRSETTMAQFPEDHPHRADLVRHAEYVLKLAAGLSMLWFACDVDFWNKHNVPAQDHGWIDADMLKRAIALMEWLWGHKQNLVDAVVEQSFSAIAGDHMIGKAESIATSVQKQVKERQRRVEKLCGEEWTVRDYCRSLRLKKEEAVKELDLFQREGHVVPLEMKEGQKAIRYKFLGEVE